MRNELTANKAVSFLTHQVRTSLSSMLGFVEMLYDSQLTPKEKWRCLGRLRSIIENTGMSLENVEYLASMDKGWLELHSVEFSLETEMTETFQFLKSLVRKNELHLNIVQEGRLPSVILSDPARLRQLITQMVTLFIGKTERGTIQLGLRLTGEQNPKLVFHVDGTGENISEECFQDICGKLVNDADGVADLRIPVAYGESAVSLSLINALVQALGGKLQCEPSKMGRGVALMAAIDPGPLKEFQLCDSLDFEDAGAKLIAQSLCTPQFSDKRFLVVEDDADISSLWGALLMKTGAEVEYATNGEEALEQASSKRYDIIFLDIQLPKLNGLEVCKRLRKRDVQTPIVAVTASSSLAAKQMSLKVGCNLYLTKPVSIESLYKIIPQLSA